MAFSFLIGLALRELDVSGWLDSRRLRWLGAVVEFSCWQEVLAVL
jgi:hypothetical protein